VSGRDRQLEMWLSSLFVLLSSLSLAIAMALPLPTLIARLYNLRNDYCDVCEGLCPRGSNPALEAKIKNLGQKYTDLPKVLETVKKELVSASSPQIAFAFRAL
jgi:hypothetical protein